MRLDQVQDLAAKHTELQDLLNAVGDDTLDQIMAIEASLELQEARTEEYTKEVLKLGRKYEC